MASSPSAPAPPDTPDASGDAADGGGGGGRVNALLSALDDAAHVTNQASETRREEGSRQQQQLVDGRLGVASSLFASLRHKHSATAEHSLRVALGCSAWAAALEMPDRLRSQLEQAALLHDIGKIAVPDAVLNKPGRLTTGELETIDASRDAARQILASARAPQALIDGVYAAAAWYDGSHRTLSLAGDQTPVIARMIAIVDAFDSMTTDQVYRPARSRERAIACLYENAGTQFDPDLVSSYCELFAQDQSRLEADVASRWLSTVAHDAEGFAWEPTVHARSESSAPAAAPADPAALFRARLVENMHDAVVFLDPQRRITDWNTGAERLTGVGETAALGKELTPALLDMSTAAGDLIADEDCPVRKAMADGLQAFERVNVMGRNGKSVSIELHAIPVVSDDAQRGAAVLMRDISSEATLEERCQALHAETTRDPMTQVANRAEFDRMLAAFVDAHLDTGLPCSLIMADIDRFKSINDTYGHQAGDEAIITFADLMKNLCRSGDLVARYGGEEFAILCADCTNATAAKRAEQIRRKLSETPHAYLGGKHLTASFGVTELQTGDTPETLLRRADRALLQAKDQGRNQVIQLGDGMQPTDTPKSGWGGLGRWFLSPITGGGPLVETRLVTNVPIELAVDKLRGFVADRDAQVLKAAESYLRLAVDDGRRSDERPVTFEIELDLSQHHEERTNSAGFAAGKYVQTVAAVTIKPRRDRDRRKAEVVERARQMLGSLQSYLMAKEVEADAVPTS
ncbi:MAG: diguanylate cyclase [Planctomycetota bacterium]